MISLLEAQASSEIENIVITTDRLFQFAQEPLYAQADPATKEALRYRSAMYQGYQGLKSAPLTTRTAVDVCRAIKAVDIDISKGLGTELMNDSTGQIVYTPPQGERVIRDLLSDWERFLHNCDDIDPLIRMAVMHYHLKQFIHLLTVMAEPDEYLTCFFSLSKACWTCLFCI